MINYLPPKSTRRWTGIYPGSFYGTLYKTFNVDLDKNEGKIGLSRRFERIEDSSELTQLSGSRVRAFTRIDADSTDRYWALTDCGLLRTDSATPEWAVDPNADWDVDALDSTPANPQDFTVHGNDSRADSGRGKLVVTTDSDVFMLNDTGDGKWTGAWWVTKHSKTGLDTSVPHPTDYFPFTGITLIGDGNLVHTISRPSDTQNDTATYNRVTLPPEYIIRHIFHTRDRSWLLCDNKFRKDGAVVEWDGSATSYNNLYPVRDAIAALSGVDYFDNPIVLNSKGRFLEFDGTSFIPMIRNGQRLQFPVAEEPENHLLEDSSDTSLSIPGRVLPRGMTVSEDGLININRRGPQYGSDKDAGGIWCLDPIAGRLYNKYALGQWGDSADYGMSQIAGAGALYSTQTNSIGRSLLAGGNILSNATTEQGGIWLIEGAHDTQPTKGYFITQLVSAEQLRELWGTLWANFKRFLNAADMIIIKAKGDRSLVLSGGLPLTGTITWTAATTFTVTLAAGDDALQVGDEVEVLAGTNAGWLAHITTIAGAHGAVQTITIDESVTTGSGTAVALFDRWKKLKPITKNTIREDKVEVGIDSPFVRFKVELRGLEGEMELSELASVSKSSINLDN